MNTWSDISRIKINENSNLPIKMEDIDALCRELYKIADMPVPVTIPIKVKTNRGVKYEL